ncbi:hypothetical protein OVA03_12795 [Asticcacaulis sp. SL142]|uniref:relaxase/mobilization nuclease domain-containing protein n=1 Tax=Asticcacaulis sp. SL142 TaxID=2995155 RepID=UPI00226C64A8|nr:hypothetical protein [Asticcacaulis sp. SL142]WAC47574.1 hypothetical protein OVA03_12795 [Asticcacaulis sp. SL142]
MILKASQRSGTRALGIHILNGEDNEHVELHEVKGFISQDILGAMSEIEIITKGTRCQQPLFSVSLNPPQTESVRVEVFEHALNMIEERLGLKDQPRMVVFHEKEGRRHAHCVWSRIDADTMTAKNLSFFKNTLREISKQLYLENGWQMPRGFVNSQERDPRNFTLAEWQQAKRSGESAKDLKAIIQECWSASDGVQAFSKALEERGLFLAKGDKSLDKNDNRLHVVVTHSGEVLSVARVIKKRGKDVTAKLGSSETLNTVAETKAHIAANIAPRLSAYIQEAKRLAANQMKPLHEQRHAMKIQHQLERQKLDAGQKARHENEVKERAARLSTGIKGVWDKLRGEHGKIKKQNEVEAYFCLQRDRKQRDDLVIAQMKERRELQDKIRLTREREAKQILALYKDAAHYRLMQAGELPEMRESLERGSGRERGSERGASRGRDVGTRSKEKGLDLG